MKLNNAKLRACNLSGPLFWWKYCPGALPALRAGSPFNPVSILVLVEVLPWVLFEVANRKRRLSFNPCSGGSIALGSQVSLGKALGRDKHTGFNPCSGGSIALGRDPLRCRHRAVFQSLFWWKYCPGGEDRNEWTDEKGVSILVLVEVLPWVSIPGDETLTGQRFNPCSGGSIALGRTSALSATKRSLSFNPCSGGSIALGASVPATIIHDVMFQSLFWWKYCPGSTSVTSGVGVKGFNPCSGGSIALGRPHAPRQAQR